MKKVIASAVTAALIVTIPGTNFVFAIETAGTRVDSVRPIEAPAGIGSMQVAPISNLSAASLDAAAAAADSVYGAAVISGAAMADGGTKAAPAGSGQKASAIEGLGAEVKQLGSETSGGPSADVSLNSFYEKTAGADSASADVAAHMYGHFVDDHIGGIVDSGLSKSWGDIAKSGNPKIARRQDGGALIGEAVVGGVVVGLAAYPRTRNFIVYTITNLYNRLRSPDSVAKEILARLEEGHAQYNQRVSDAKNKVTTLERSMKQLQDEAAPIASQLDKKSGELAAMMKDKEGDALAAVKNSASFKSAYAEAMTLQQNKARIDGRVASAQKDVAVAQTAYESAMKEREQFFNIEAERMAAVQSRMTEKDAGVLNQQMAAMKDKYQLKGGEQMDVLTGKTNDEVAKGKAAMDSVNSSGAAQKANAEESARQRGNEDALDALIKSKSDNKGGSNVQGFDASTSKIFRYGTWVALAGAAFMAPGYALVGAGVLGIAAIVLAMSHPKAAQHIGGDLAVVGTGTLAIGILASKIGIGVSIVGSSYFVAAGAVAALLGVLAIVNAYMHRAQSGSAAPAPAPSEQAKAEIPAVQRVDIFAGIGAQMSRAAQAVSKIGSAGKTAAGAAASNASSAASKGVDAVEGVADAAQKAADQMASEAPADAPSTGELASRAGSAVKKTAEAAGTIAGAAAKQAGAQARQAADKGIGAVEGMAQKAAEAAGAMSAQPGVDAPSAKELLSRLQNLSAKLGDIGMTVAENQVSKIEAKVDPNAPKIDNANSAMNLVKRFFTAIATLIGMKADQAMTQLESDPQYQAWLMKTKMAKAEKDYQNAVFVAAKAYHAKEIEIEQGKEESDKLAGQIATLLKPRVNGEAPSAQNEKDARTLVESKRIVDLGVIANLKVLGDAKRALDAIVEQRATAIADATEKMIGVKAGLTEAEIGTLKKNIATLQSDFVQSMGEINERFKAEVTARVSGGEAAMDAANGNPAVAIAEAKKRADAIQANDEVQRIKQQLAGK